MDFVIAGVSGNTGSVVAETLLAQGKGVRVLVRDPAKGAAWKAKGASVSVADVQDEGALTEALRGAAGAYLLLPPNMAAADFRAYQREVGTKLVNAVKASGVGHVVLLSSVGAQHPDRTGPIAGLHPVEEALRALPIATTFVRAAYFMENLGGSLGMLDQGVLPSFQRPDLAFEMVATQDIGRTAAQALVEGSRGHEVIELGGPQKYSFDDAAAALSKLTGRAVKAQHFGTGGMSKALQSFGFPAGMADLYQEMTESLETGRVAFEGTHRTVRGITSLETLLARLLKKG